MQTLVFGIDSYREYIEPGFPVLYPLLREKKLVLLSLREDAPDPVSSVAVLDNYRFRGNTSWQAIILISGESLQEGGYVSLASYLHQLYQEQLALVSQQMGTPERVWVLSLNGDSSALGGGAIQPPDQVGYITESAATSPWLFTLNEINSLETTWNSFSGQLFQPDNTPETRFVTLDAVREQLENAIKTLTAQKIRDLPSEVENSFFNESRYLSVEKQFNDRLSDYLAPAKVTSVRNFSPADLLKEILREEFSLFSDYFKRWFFISLSHEDLSRHFVLPYLVSTLTQWEDSGSEGGDKFWRLDEISVDSTALAASVYSYHIRMEQILNQVQEQIASPLSTRVSLLLKPYPQSATKFVAHDDLHSPEVKSSSAWGDWKDKTQKRLADYQDKGKKLLATIGEELRQGKGREEKQTIADIDAEIVLAEDDREQAWQKFRKLQHLKLTHDWDAAISGTEYRLLELFSCRPTQVQRWATAFVGLLFFLLPIIVLTVAKGWSPELYQRNDFIISCSVIFVVCFGLVLLLYLRYRLILRRLCRAAAGIANGIFKKITADTENNVIYLLDLFNFSVAEQNLRRLKRSREDLLQQRSRWIWFETEVRRHLNWASMLSSDCEREEVRDENPDPFDFNFEQESQQPCSQSPVFALSEVTGKTEISVVMGHREDKIKIEDLPGMERLHLVKDIY